MFADVACFVDHDLRHLFRYSVQFNAARLDTLPVEPHDRGWAVYPSGLLLPVNFSLGAERCWAN